MQKTILAASLLMSAAAIAGWQSGEIVSAAGRAAKAPSPVTSTSLVADKGTFRILVKGKEAGREQFEIVPNGSNWTIRGNASLQSTQGEMRVNGTLQLRGDGSPVRYDWATDGAKKASATIAFNGPTASIDLKIGNSQPYTQQFTFGSAPVVLDNNLYDQYAVLAGLYDWSKKGVQSFSVLVPQELTPGTVSVESLGKQDSDGKQLDELLVKTDDLELDLYLDKGHLMRIAVPSSDAEVIRD